MSNTDNIGNIIILKNGEGAPTNGTLQTAELGFDKSNNKLYIGDKNGDSVLISPRHHSLDTTNYWIQDSTNIDSLVSNGWYSYGENNISTNKPFTYGDIFVLQHGTTNNCCQIAGNRTSNNPSLKVRKLQNGVWSNWYDIYTSTDKIPLTNGGTGQNLSTCPNGALIRNSIDNTGLWYIQSKPGALYSNATDGIATFGTLPIAYGGTGATTAKVAEYNIHNGIAESTATTSDNTQLAFKYVTPSTSNGVFYYKTALSLWNYIVGKIRSVFGFTSSNVLPISNGGTGATSASEARTKLGFTLGNLGITASASNINYISEGFLHRFTINTGNTHKIIFSGRTNAIITAISAHGQSYGTWVYNGYGTGGTARSHLSEIQCGTTISCEISAVDNTNKTHGFLIEYNNSADPDAYIDVDILLIKGTLNSYNTTTQTITNPIRRYGETLPSPGIPGRIFYKKVES